MRALEELTDRQREILEYISRYIDENGYPPTVREIGTAFSIRSTNGVADHLKSLERKGYLERGSLKSRALRPVRIEQPDPTFNHDLGSGGARVTSLDAHRRKVSRPNLELVSDDNRLVTVPVLGQVAAGAPILAEEHARDSVQIDSVLLGSNHRKVFALRIVGDSMIGDGIFDGDYIFVRKQLVADDGQIVVAMIENEATVKRIYREGDRVRLQPSNPRLQPIYVNASDFRDTQILGVVVGVYRKMP